MQPLISVIVPIYNVEKYLTRAIDSICSQTYQNLEILLVEDGATDKSPQICDAYAEKDNRITVIHKENGGLSDARNTGLEHATGEYVAFIDSDDYIAGQFIEKLYHACIKTNSDMAICSYRESSSMENIFEKEEIDIKMNEMEVLDRKELLFDMYEEYRKENTEFIVSWNKLYRKSLWDNIRFPKGRIHEDEATTYKIYDKCSRGVYIKDKLYAYYLAEQSITRQSFSAKRMDWFTALKERIDFFEQRKEYLLALQSCKTYADASIRFYKRYLEETDNSKEFCERCRRNVKDIMEKSKKYGKFSCRTKLGYCIFLIYPKLFYKLVDN